MTNASHSPSTSTASTDHRSTPGWVLPAAACLAAVAIGAGLIVADGRSSSGDTTASSVEDSPPVDSASAEVSTTGETDVSTAPATAAVVSANTPTEDEPEVVGPSALIDGRRFDVTSSCVHFPNSNPAAEILDAHINVSLFQMVADFETPAIVESWSSDGFSEVGVGFLDGGPVTLVEGNAADGLPIEVPVADGTATVVPTDLFTPGNTCSTMLVTDPTDAFSFQSFGLADRCLLPFDHPTGDGILSFQGGNRYVYLNTDDPEAEPTLGRFESADGTVRTVSDASFAVEGDSSVVTGKLSPGFSADVDDFRLEFSSPDVATRTCSDAEIASVD